MTWKKKSEDMPSPCAIILSMGRDPKIGRSYDVVCEATKVDGHWYANACGIIDDRIRGWTTLPSYFNGASEDA